MRSFAQTAGVGVMDKAPFPFWLQVPDQHVVHHPVAKGGGEDLTSFGFLNQKGYRATGAVDAAGQFLV